MANIEKNMKILQLIDVYKTGGAEKVYDLFYEWTKEQNLNSEKILFYKSELVNNRYLVSCNRTSIFHKLNDQIIGLIKLKKIIIDEKIDYIVSFLDRSNILSVCAAKSVSNVKKIIVTIHNPPTVQYEKLGKLLRLIVFYILRHFYNNKRVKVIAVSRAVEESLRSIGIKNIETVVNPMRNLSDEISYKDKVTSNEKYFLAIGRLEYQKAYWKLIKGFYLFKKKTNTEIKLKILGEGIYKQKLSRLISALDMDNDIQLVGYINNPQPYINNSEGMLFTSIYEGFPITLLENVRAKKPFVGSDCSIPIEMKELMGKDYETCTFKIECTNENFMHDEFESDDYNFANVLEKLLDEEYCKRQIEMTSEWFYKNCSIENFARYFNE